MESYRYTPVTLVFDVVEPDEYDPNKTPVIFLHGMSATKEDWHDIPRHIANITGRKVYVLDARNHGDSPWSNASHFDSNRDDVINFMNTHNVSKAIFVGHSMGAVTAMQIALKMPERVEKLFVEDMSVKPISPQVLNAIEDKLKVMKTAIKKLPNGLDEEDAKKFIADFVYGTFIPYTERIKKIDSELKKTEDGRFAFKINLDSLPHAVRCSNDLLLNLAGSYVGPTCFIYGKLSKFNVGSHKDQIKEFFPNVEFVGVENATHEVHNDCSEDFSKTLFNFISRE